jgi:hypothetical protein
MTKTDIELGDIVRIGFPGSEGARAKVVEDMGDGTFAVAFHDGTAEVYSSGWLKVVES